MRRSASLRARTALLDEGRRAIERGEFATALRLLGPLAEQGASAAQLALGMMYNDGSGVAQDHAEAARWFRLAIETDPSDGFAKAMLANIEAADKFKNLAYRGDADARYRLGFLATGSDGAVPKDDALAYLLV